MKIIAKEHRKRAEVKEHGSCPWPLASLRQESLACEKAKHACDTRGFNHAAIFKEENLGMVHLVVLLK
jgi:hypothetical protein